MAKGANYDADEVHAVCLAGLEVHQGKQEGTDVLHGKMKAAYERHCEQLGVAAKQRTGQSLWEKYKSTRKEIVNTITPVYNKVVNTDGSIPSGKNKDDVETEVLDGLYAQSLDDEDKKDEEKRAALRKKHVGCRVYDGDVDRWGVVLSGESTLEKAKVKWDAKGDETWNNSTLSQDKIKELVNAAAGEDDPNPPAAKPRKKAPPSDRPEDWKKPLEWTAWLALGLCSPLSADPIDHFSMKCSSGPAPLEEQEAMSKSKKGVGRAAQRSGDAATSKHKKEAEKENEKAAKKVKLDKALDEISHAVALQKWESKGRQLKELMGLAVPGTDGYNDLKDQYIAHLKNMPKDPTADDAS